MKRELLFIAIGAVMGSALVFYATGTTSLPTPDSGDRSAAAAPAAAVSSGTNAASGPSEAHFLAISERAAALAEAELRLEIERVAYEPASFQRSVELGVLLDQLAALDPEQAVRVGESVDLPMRAMERLYRLWMQADHEAVLEGLSRVTPPAMRRGVALMLLEVLGDDDAAIERVGSRLASVERSNFSLDATARRGAREPGAVPRILDQASMLTRTVLVTWIATAAARADAPAALAVAADIGDAETRVAYVARVMEAWAELDPVAVLEYLERSGMGAFRGDARTLQAIAAVDPERMLALAEGQAPEVRLAAQRAALAALADVDAAAALTRLEGVAVGRDRDQLLRTISTAYAQQDVDAAIAWMNALDPPSQAAVSGVVAGIAARDYDRAVDLVLLAVQSGRSDVDFAQAIPAGALFRAVNEDPANVTWRLNRLVASGNATLQARAAAGAMVWSQRQPSAAVDWAVMNLEEIGTEGLRIISQQVALTDPLIAGQTVGRLPDEARTAWVDGAVEALARLNPEGAAAFEAQYRESPGSGDDVP